MLSSVLRSDIAVQTSVLITRAFVAMRQMIANSPVIMSAQHQKEMKELKEYIEDVFADQNDINEFFISSEYSENYKRQWTH